MADVYLAVSGGPGGFNKLSVLKLLRDFGEQQGLDMFLEEARLAARLNHHNVVQTYEVGTEEDQYFIAMEFIDGPALHKLRKRVSIPLPIGLHVMSLVLDGLRYAHALTGFDGASLGLVHRDLSPQNVLVTYEGHCKIVDFGVAKALDSALVTRGGLFKGKVAYMPPEQAMGEAVDQRADVFAAGVMLFELITGRRLWQGETELSLLLRLREGGVPRLVGPPAGVGSELIDLCNWALEPELERRCPSAGALLEGLEGHIRSAGLSASRRDLGALVAGAFAVDREKLQRTIADQLLEVKSTPTGQYRALVIPHASYGSASSSSSSGEARPLVATQGRGEPPTPEPLSEAAVGKPPRRALRARWLWAVMIGSAISMLLGALAVRSMRTPSTPPQATLVATPPPPEPQPAVAVTPAPTPPSPKRPEAHLEAQPPEPEAEVPLAAPSASRARATKAPERSPRKPSRALVSEPSTPDELGF